MLLALILAACGTSAPAPAEPVFVRGGVVLGEALSGARALSDGRWLVEKAWRPGDEVTLPGGAVRAPRVAECVPLFHQPLGDVARRVVSGGSAPDTALAFAPDGARLAVGSYHGEVWVLDGWSGAVKARRRLAESMVKQVAWSPDGGTLYAAEQSPDALLHALDPDTLATRWSLRLADRVGTSAPSSADDVYGVYTLPAAYGLHVRDDGTLLVAAVHAWDEAEGRRRNASQLLVVTPDGAVAAAWPPEPASVTLMHPRVGGGAVAVPVGRSATGDAPALPIGGVQVLALPDLAPRTSRTYPPLAPFYDDVFVWEAVDIDADTLLVGLADGRVYWHDLGTGAEARRDLGTPVRAGEVPVGATIGHAALIDGAAVVLTFASTIPWGAADPALRPPAPHPAENALHVLDAALRDVWTWRGPHALHGFAASPDQRALVVGAGARTTDRREDLFGALVFRLDGEGGGAERLQTFCATAAPVFFRQAVTDDGRVAVVEVPYPDGAGGVRGAYRVTVLR